MVIGEIIHEQHYVDVFQGLLELINTMFENVDSGIQGDAWIWIFEEEEKVSLDTFSSMRFQIRVEKKDGQLLDKILSILESKYKLSLYEEPEFEN